MEQGQQRSILQAPSSPEPSGARIERGVVESAMQFVPVLLVILVTLLVLRGVRRFFSKRPVFSNQHAFLRSILILSLVASGVIGVLLALPFEHESMRSDLMKLVGIVVSAAIALSSTTFVGNAMAGFMLRIVRNFRSGDWVRVGEHFGRVSEQGIFHTEIQTERSNLTTLPNLFLVTNPVTVVRDSGTVVSARVSLGYDIPHSKIETVLGEAAEEAGLTDPFVQIMDLGDYSVTYRCAGLLPEAKQLLPAQSRLRSKMLDCLHRNDIEIVSPSFINRREVSRQQQFIPTHAPATEEVPHGPQDEVVFSKAERAASIESLREQLKDVVEETADFEEELKDEPEADDRERLEKAVKRNQVYRDYLAGRLQKAEAAIREDDETVM